MHADAELEVVLVGERTRGQTGMFKRETAIITKKKRGKQPVHLINYQILLALEHLPIIN